jgi:5-methylphenazine-1-carboxylate 1-monooxygenase
VLTNRSGGPESPLSIVAARAPDGFDRIEDVMSPEELAEIADRYRRLTGSDVEHLNRRPSLSVGPAASG